MSFTITAVSQNLEEFYAGSSVFVPNKFMVFLDGPYLTRAIDNMEQLVVQNKLSHPIDYDNFFKWKAAHVTTTSSSEGTPRGTPEGIKDSKYGENKFQEPGSAVSNDNWGDIDFQVGKGKTGKAKTIASGYQLKFLWACKDISIPLVDIGTDIDEQIGMSLDSIRNLKYTLVTDYTKDDEITMTVIEQKGMIWYQFFNELGNMFYDTKLMTARDSVKKLRMRIDTLVTDDKATEDYTAAYDLGQQFEFNSIVFTGADNLSFSQDSEEPMEHNISFKIANPFQKPFKHDYAGLKNRVHDDDFVTGTGYNISGFESAIPNDVQQYEDFITDDSRADQ